jgi:hypothetical protein
MATLRLTVSTFLGKTHYGMRVPYRKVKELFQLLFRMAFVPASAMGFDRAATRKGQPLYEDLKEKLRAALTANADETGWRQDGLTITSGMLETKISRFFILIGIGPPKSPSTCWERTSVAF